MLAVVRGAAHAPAARVVVRARGARVAIGPLAGAARLELALGAALESTLGAPASRALDLAAFGFGSAHDDAEERAALAERAARAVDPGNPALEEGDTIYLCTADSDGMMVSLIQSNYRGMGSGMTPPGLGFCLQDRGELFDMAEGRPNSYAPGKRPFHTIIPAFMTKDGAPLMAFGVMGGATQPQGHVQIVVNMVDLGMTALPVQSTM